MEKLYCAHCGEELDINEGFFVDDELYCEDCLDELFVECDDCGEYIRRDEVIETGNGRIVCEDCLDRYYTRCEDCGEYYPADEMNIVTSLGDTDYYICDDCRNYGDYYRCDNCGDLFHADDMRGDYCLECYDEIFDDILEYHGFDDWHGYFVSNINESVLKGFELEVQSGDRRYLVDELKDIVGDFCVYEQDGSLDDDDGVEIISNPFTMQWLYQNEGMFADMMKCVKNNCYDTYRTGLHIHVDREQLTNETSLSEDEVIDNILILMEVFQDELTKFSRRNKDELNEWAKFLTNGEVKKHVIDAMKNGRRYRAVNLTNENTIEFRIFNSTHELSELFASIELVDNIVNLAKHDIDGLSWNDLVSKGKYVTQYTYDSDTRVDLFDIAC